MPDAAISLSPEEKKELLRRYTKPAAPLDDLTYGTVKDFCDSSDHLPFLSHVQGDLKDLQRPAAFKMILGLLPPGSRLLEVGAGDPMVAHALAELGYTVTVIDPYDGSGNGPTEFEHYVAKYPSVKIQRMLFNELSDNLQPSAYDCIYSISVLEHVHQPALSALFQGVRRFLKTGGYSLHVVDHVLEGDDADFHLIQLTEILRLQAALSSKEAAQAKLEADALLIKLARDIDTYYLSAEGHNRWRGATPYELFPFRKVVSIHSCGRRPR